MNVLVRVLVAVFGVIGCPALFGQAPTLSNLSTRAQIGTGGNILIAGLTIGPGGNRTVLLRAAGPTIGAAPFSVPGALADPKLELFSGSSKIAENDNWGVSLGGALPVTAATFSSVGAFAFGNNSRDAALLANLAPGSYTVQVSGVNNTTGVAIVEAYEVGTSGGRLVNLSARAQVGTASNILIPGFVLAPGTGTRRLLIRAVGPSLASLGVTTALNDPQIVVTNSAGTPAFSITNDNWATPVSESALPGEVLATAFAQAGAFGFDGSSRDAAVMVELPAGSYTIQTSGVGNTTGVSLVEVYDLTPATLPVVTLAATKTTSDESGNNLAEFTFTRAGETWAPLTVRYGVGGSAVNGFDYPPLSGSITIPAGATSVKLPLSPNPDVQNEGTDTVTLTLAPANGYTIGGQSAGTITITDSPASLYVATLRPPSNATDSTAYGTASILLSSTGTLASVNVSFSNLSSAQVTAHLTTGTGDDYVANLPQGQVTGAQWLFSPTGPYTGDALLNALKSGNISVRIDSARYPGGELRGAFIVGSGSQTFTPPAAPPAVSLINVTAADAARLLTQATFGPKKSEIDALAGQSIDAWITAQLALPFTSHRTATVADRTTYGGSNSVTNWNAIHPNNRQAAWWKTVLTSPDQLRQRVAFALSEIFVVSDVSLGDDSRSEPLANYYDILGNGAFGNFRTLLENVTLSPIMGEYLSSLRNAKANPATGTTPDENYAREIMQLFTIGLEELLPDGTLKLDAAGLPIPTYNQATITELAKVFTGWAYPSTNLNNFRTAGANYISPMQLFPAFHEDAAKNLAPVGGVIPASQGGVRDLQIALDTLFNHPNTGPFIARRLIQRLVTSNPSPAYVYRVAQKFADNGSGVRGDLAAVVRAILTDYEARSPEVATNVSFGKLKEPLLRLTGLFRSFNVSARGGRYTGFRYAINGVLTTSTTPNPNDQSLVVYTGSGQSVTSTQNQLAESALRSPTVFNFFVPNYVVPGPLAAAGLVAPEFQITDDSFAITVPNFLRDFILANNTATTLAADQQLVLDFTYEQTLVTNPAALIDHLSLLLAGGTLPDSVRSRVTTALTALPASATALDRARSAVLIIVTSPAGAVQR